MDTNSSRWRKEGRGRLRKIKRLLASSKDESETRVCRKWDNKKLLKCKSFDFFTHRARIPQQNGSECRRLRSVTRCFQLASGVAESHLLVNQRCQLPQPLMTSFPLKITSLIKRLLFKSQKVKVKGRNIVGIEELLLILWGLYEQVGCKLNVKVCVYKYKSW